MSKKRVLVISRNAWSNQISTGNTLSNFFQNCDKDCIANLYCRSEKISNTVCEKYFKITEQALVKGLLSRKEAGEEKQFEAEETFQEISQNKQNAKMYAFFRNFKLTIFLWAREILWKVGKWKGQNLETFLKEFAPEIIYMPIYDCFYMHDILRFVQKRTGASVVLFTGDDMYSLKQFSLSPLYWINRLILRKKIRNSVELSDIRYCLTPEQKNEYQMYFNKDFSLLIKEAANVEFSKDSEISKEKEYISFVYTGNIDKGRYESLVEVAKKLEELKVKHKAKLFIYSGSSLSAGMLKKLNSFECVQFMGEAPNSEIPAIQRQADIVLHVESLRIKERLKTRLSFSTKIIDYMQNQCCILAIGWEKASSIRYFDRSKTGYVVTDYKDLKKALELLIENEPIRKEFSERALCYAQKHHKFGTNSEILEEDFSKL